MIPFAQKIRLYLFASLCVLALVACQNKPIPFHGADINGVTYGKNWLLTDQSGQPRQAKDYKGHLQLIYFGFTQCPDICPATLQRMQAALDLVPPETLAKQPIDILFITVDPETDTVEVLKNYLKPFGSHVIGLTGSQAEVDAAAKDFKVYVQQSSKNSKMFEHSGFIYLMDKEGRARLMYAPETSAKDIAEDLGYIVAAAGTW
jgi:protein SCO1/2